MNVKQIIEKYLKDNGFAGLVGDDCGCDINDLWPCSEISLEWCEPGYAVPCDGTCEDGKCDGHLVAEKPKESHETSKK